jgi:lipid-A-disaccharide synthase
MNPWTYRLVKGKLETEFVTLPNYLANQALIPELIQDQATTQAIVNAIQPQLKEGVSDLFLAQAQSIHETLTGDVTDRASDAILDELL